jgi:hypothetical protein
MKKITAAAAVLVVVLATAVPAAASAQGSWFDVPIYLFEESENPCTGAPQTVEGPGWWRIHWLEIDQGNGDARFHWNIRTELDLMTSDGFIGEHYLARSTVNSAAPYLTPADHYVESSVINIRFEHPDTGQAFRVKANFHITGFGYDPFGVTPFEEVTAFVDSWTTSCLKR